MLRRLAGLTALLALGASMLAIPPATGRAADAPSARGCTTRPSGLMRVCFTSPPANGGTDDLVFAELRRLFGTAGKGDRLRIAMFRWDRSIPAQSLLDAQRRGARVDLVVDHEVVTNGVGRRLARLVERRGRGDNVRICRGACLPRTGRGVPPPGQDVAHLKLFLLDIDGKRTVATTSANIERAQLRQYNTLLQVRDRGLWRYHRKLWTRLRAESWKGWSPADRVSRTTPRVWVYPTTKDPLTSLLHRTRCVRTAHSVDVVVAHIRRHDVRRELVALRRRGCDVRVVVTDDAGQNWMSRRVRLGDGTRARLDPRQVRTINLHDKIYLLHAKVDGQVRRLVVTGTSNATCGGLLYNDEVMWRLDDAWLWRQFRRHVADLYSRAHQSASTGSPEHGHCR